MKNKYILLLFICSLLILAVIFVFLGLKTWSPEIFEETFPLINNDLEQANPGGVHIVSWNTGFFSKNADFGLNESVSGIKPLKEGDIALLTDFLVRQPADILLLQETTSENARLFADLFPKYNIYYASGYKSPVISSIFKSRREKGMTVMAGIPLEESYSSYPENLRDENKYRYFFQITSFESSEKNKYWMIINCGTNEYPEKDTRRAILEYLPDYMNSLNKNKYYIIIAGDFSAFSNDEINILKKNLPAGWKIYTASNKPDGRDPGIPYDRLKSKTWNKVLFISYKNTALVNIVSHDMRFKETPGNPVSAIFSISE